MTMHHNFLVVAIYIFSTAVFVVGFFFDPDLSVVSGVALATAIYLKVMGLIYGWFNRFAKQNRVRVPTSRRFWILVCAIFFVTALIAYVLDDLTMAGWCAGVVIGIYVDSIAINESHSH